MLGVALVGCEHGQVPGLAFRSPQIIIRNVQEPVDPQSPSGSSRVMVEAEVVEDSSCTPLDGSFGGTFRGAPMTVASYGSLDQGFCERPTVAIDPLAVTPADGVITIFDSTASISATIDPADALDARSIDASRLDLMNNVSFDVRWSHPVDLTQASLSLSFRQTFAGPCDGFEGCFGEEFTTFGSVLTADPALVTFQPFFSTGAANGEIVIRAGTTAGQADCEALSCTFELDHLVVLPGSASL
jgi:hypothetical protein